MTELPGISRFSRRVWVYVWALSCFPETVGYASEGMIAMGKLTHNFVKSVTKPGRYSDGDTLLLKVTPGGARTWIQRVVIDRKRRDIGLGPFPLVTLREARDKAFENRRAVRAGADPLAEKRKAKTPTFRQSAAKTLEANRARWRHRSTAEHWTRTMDKHVFPVLGDMAVDVIGAQDVLRVLTPLWTASPEIGRKVRQRIRAVLRWCEAHGFVDRNVAGEGLDGALPTMPRVRQHFRALPYGEVQGALETLDASPASLAAKYCLRFVALTAVRSGEAREATWTEIDMGRRTWMIPASRMKANAEHRVPLSDAALAVLVKARALDDGSGLLFPSPRRGGKPLSNLTKVLRDVGLADRTTVHGLRSSFRDWCAETGKPRELAEAALAHTVAGVEGAYFRSDLFERRRRLMEQWGAFLTGDRAKVVELHRG